MGARILAVGDGGIGAAESSHIFQRTIKATELIKTTIGLFVLHCDFNYLQACQEVLKYLSKQIKLRIGLVNFIQRKCILIGGVINSIYAQIYIRTMKVKQYCDSAGYEITDTEWSWTESNILKEKNRNSTLCLSPLQSQPFSKKLFLANKTLHSKIHKLPLQQENSFLKVEQLTSQFKIYQHARKKSNIQLLKRQFQYLEQDSFDREQFPRTTCCQIYSKSREKKAKKCMLMASKAFEGATQVIKGFTGGPLKNISHSEQKLKRKWLKSKEKRQISEQKQNREIKTHTKYEVMVPYSKYFPANRFRKNRSSTMKVDELLGRRVGKLGQLSGQQGNK